MKTRTKAKKTRRRKFQKPEESVFSRIHGLAEAAKQIAEEEKAAARHAAAEDEHEKPTTNGCVLNYMYENFPREDWTLDTYLMLAYWDGRGIEDLGPEEIAELPPEVYPPPETEEIQ